MLKINNILMILLLLASCSENILIKYSVISDGDFEVLYSENIKDEGYKYWSSERYENDVFIYVKPTDGNELDVRVMYIGKRGLTLYNREIGEGPILIQGKIYDL